MSVSIDLTSIINTALGSMPSILQFIRDQHPPQPGQPPLTDEQVLQALSQAVSSTIAKDDAWIAIHTPPPPASAAETNAAAAQAKPAAAGMVKEPAPVGSQVEAVNETPAGQKAPEVPPGKQAPRKR